MAGSPTTEADMAQVRRILARDRVWATYALADLQPHLAPHCRWLTASSPTGSSPTGEALALIYYGLEPPVLFTMGDAPVLARLLAGAELPPRAYISAAEHHLPVLADLYDLAADLRPMRRMVLADPQAALRTPPGRAQGPDEDLVWLRGAHVPAVLKLLAHGGPFTPDAFAPAQIDAGVFYGLFEGEELLAVGGTHVVDFAQGIAAIGNMYTHPNHRRRGLSARILRAIVQELLACGVTTIVLNVDQRNPGAQALYLAHGFIVHVPYFEGKGNRNAVRVLKEKQTL